MMGRGGRGGKLFFGRGKKGRGLGDKRSKPKTHNRKSLHIGRDREGGFLLSALKGGGERGRRDQFG